MVLLQSLPEVHRPAPGAALQVLSEDRFKRARFQLCLDLPLDERRAARSLLLPVLQQGCAAHPSRVVLARQLQEAFGATIHIDGDRAAEFYRTTVTVSWVGERFLPADVAVLPQMLELVRQLLFEPLRGSDGAPFRTEVVERERAQMLRQIASLKDDRSRWAEERFLEEMCAGEPYGLHSWDSADAVAALDGAALEEARLELLQSAQVSAFAVGPVEAAPLAAWLADAFGGRPTPPELAPITLRDAGELREVREQLPMEQAQFQMGFRYRPATDLAGRCASAMASAILGGGAHGRLFRVVREERSLAYGIYSMLRSLKGLMTVSAGIDGAAYENVRDEVLHQLADLATAGPTEEELQLALTAKLDRLTGLGDSAGGLLGYLERSLLIGDTTAPAAQAAALQETTAAQIADAAAQWKPDLVYLLEPGEEEQA